MEAGFEYVTGKYNDGGKSSENPNKLNIAITTPPAFYIYMVRGVGLEPTTYGVISHKLPFFSVFGTYEDFWCYCKLCCDFKQGCAGDCEMRKQLKLPPHGRQYRFSGPVLKE
ncbi:MAG: hypothetical protein QXI71_02160 [Candidatus Bathyarchaeia archaeon]|nr:hypothetical protein [Candidatus Bathyarchaeota archaeon]